MNYIYDVLLNFSSELYDFYEWNKDDLITHIKKIPVVKVKKNILNDFKNNKVKIDDIFLSKYRNKTEKFLKKNVTKIEDCIIFTDGFEALAILFKKNISLFYSKLLLDEEEELLIMSKMMEYRDINYEILSQINNEFLITKNDKLIRDYSINKISNIINLSELECLYYECFNKKPSNNINIQKDELTKFIINSKSSKIYDFYKLVDAKK